MNDKKPRARKRIVEMIEERKHHVGSSSKCIIKELREVLELMDNE